MPQLASCTAVVLGALALACATSAGVAQRDPGRNDTDPLGQSPPVEDFVRLGAGRVHFIEWRNPAGQPVLLLPGIGGGGGSGWQWAGVASSLQRKHRVLVLEPRGFGESEWAPDYSWQAVVGDVHRFVEHLRLAPVVLVGHSFGARLAMLYAAAHPEKISRLVLVDVDAVAAMEPQPPATLTITFASPEEAFGLAKTRWGTAAVVDDVVRKWLKHGLKRNDNGRWVWRLDPRLRDEFARTLPNEAQLRQQARKVKAPTLVIRGAKSTFTRERAEALAAAFTDARLAEVPESGHVVHLANPAGFLAALSHFVDGRVPSN